MSNLFGGGGSKNEPFNVNIPAFESAGGITPQQQALGQYSYGQDLMGQAELFGGSGTGESTMATQGAEGARNKAALQMAGMSDTNQEAQYQLYQNDIQNIEGGLANAATLDIAPGASPATSLGSLATGAGFSVNPGASLA